MRIENGKLIWNDDEREHIKMHREWYISPDDGILVIPQWHWDYMMVTHPDLYGISSMAHPGSKQIVMASSEGTCLYFEHRHFVVTEHPAFPHMTPEMYRHAKERRKKNPGFTREKLRAMINTHEYDWKKRNLDTCDTIRYELVYENYHALNKMLREHSYEEARAWLANNT